MINVYYPIFVCEIKLHIRDFQINFLIPNTYWLSPARHRMAPPPPAPCFCLWPSTTTRSWWSDSAAPGRWKRVETWPWKLKNDTVLNHQ